MFPSVRANFDPAPSFIAHFHTLAPGFLRVTVLRVPSPFPHFEIATAKPPATIAERLIYCICRSAPAISISDGFARARHPVYSDNTTDDGFHKKILRGDGVRACVLYRKHFTEYKI